MLIGEYQNLIDAKNRCIIPAKFREDLGESCILTKGLDECLILYPMSTWKRQQKSLEELPMADKEARAFRRFIYANAFECEIDKQGRILIPASLKESAGIEKELITIGMSDRVEIWGRESFENSASGGQLSAESFADFSDKYQV